MATRKRPPTARQVELARTDIRLIRAQQTTPRFNWRDDAKCRTEDPELFYPTDAAPVAKPLRVCAACPVRTWCLADALDSKDQFGIRGGTTEDERRPMFIAWYTKPGDPLPEVAEEPAPRPKLAPSTTCHRGHEKEGRDKNGTPYCLICKAAQVAKLRGRSHVNRPRPVSCGTVVGAEAHYRRKETVCEPCGTAVADVGLQVPA